MNNEAECCTIIKNSFITLGQVMWKIPDPSGQYTQTIQRPFDLFGTWRGKPIYMEVKYINKLKSFDLQRIEEHQITSLLALKNVLPESICCIALGVKVGRGDNRIYFFTDIYDIERRRTNKQNYKKKELESLPYYPIHKDLIQLETN